MTHDHRWNIILDIYYSLALLHTHNRSLGPWAPSRSNDRSVNFRRIEIIVYWSCNHHMTFSRVLASLEHYRESLSDKSPILPLLQLKHA